MADLGRVRGVPLKPSFSQKHCITYYANHSKSGEYVLQVKEGGGAVNAFLLWMESSTVRRVMAAALQEREGEMGWGVGGRGGGREGREGERDIGREREGEMGWGVGGRGGGREGREGERGRGRGGGGGGVGERRIEKVRERGS